MLKKLLFALVIFLGISQLLLAGNCTALPAEYHNSSYEWSNSNSCNLTVTVTKTNCCINDTNGTATALAAGGTGSYTYSWAPSGGTNSTASNLSPGTYTVTVIDSVGCTATASVTIIRLPYVINTVAGSGPHGFSGDGGQATAAKLWFPYGLALDAAGDLFIADDANQRIRKVNTNGIITTIAGNGFNTPGGYSGDGGPATAAEFYDPVSVWVDGPGNVYVADEINYVVRKINTSGIITTIAGNNTLGCCADGGAATATGLAAVYGITTDPAGNVYFSDVGNQAIRKVTPTGFISLFAGSDSLGFPCVHCIGYGGDGGQATAAYLNNPDGIAFDPSGNLYIADYFNNRIRKVNTNGIISTFAGNGFGSPNSGGFSGDGGQATAAELYRPWNVNSDKFGNIYIVDGTNNRVRMVNVSGIITTIAGTGSGSFNGDGILATKANMGPTGVAVDASGNIFIADNFDNRIRELPACAYCGIRTVGNAVSEPTCNGSNGSAEAITLGGIGDSTTQFRYSWAPVSGNTQQENNLSAGSYTVTVTDSIGCSSSASVILTSSNVVANITAPDSICQGDMVTLTASGGASYLWNNGSTDATISVIMNADSNFMVTVSSGPCNGQATKIVRVGTDATLCALAFYTGITPNGDGHNDYWQIDNIQLYPNNTVDIYNRWGNVVWSGTGYDNNKVVWKGQDSQNKPLPDGTYYYLVKLNAQTYKGWVQLTR